MLHKRILDSLYKQFTAITKAEVKISKMNPPMGGEIEKVSITLIQLKSHNYISLGY